MNSVTQDTSKKNKHIVVSFFNELNEAVLSKIDTNSILEKYLSKNCILNITNPFEEMAGVEAYADNFWNPLLQSFPDLENQPYILVAGTYEDRHYVSCTGNLIGTFKKEWLGIPPTQQPMWLRYAGHFMMENDKITKAWYFFDMIDVMRQAGFNFFPNRGVEIVPPAPMTGDGIVTYDVAPEEGQKTLDLTHAMLNGLGNYDGKSLDSMRQEQFWDRKNMMWYGPSGIGTTRGLEGFQKNHQIPFITAFPDRGITEKIGQDYFTQIGEGNYSCDFGFPAMYGTHLHDGWLGLKATGKKITLRVVDYWRREGDVLKENWVFIDIPHIMKQLGIDVFEELKKKLTHLS